MDFARGFEVDIDDAGIGVRRMALQLAVASASLDEAYLAHALAVGAMQSAPIATGESGGKYLELR